MSISALHAQDKPYVCDICHKEIKDGEPVVVILFGQNVYNVKGYEFGNWVIEFNYADFEIVHDGACYYRYTAQR